MTAQERAHLRESGATSMAKLKINLTAQLARDPSGAECWDCYFAAKRLGILEEVQQEGKRLSLSKRIDALQHQLRCVEERQGRAMTSEEWLQDGNQIDKLRVELERVELELEEVSHG